MTDDRTVHARFLSQNVVRYDRAGQWWIEHEPSDLIPARRVSLAEAVKAAVDIKKRGGVVFLGRPGGSTFDRVFHHEFR